MTLKKNAVMLRRENVKRFLDRNLNKSKADSLFKPYVVGDIFGAYRFTALLQVGQTIRIANSTQAILIDPINWGHTMYRLGPFVVGWYEALMAGPMAKDIEFAQLFEQYMKEGGGERIMSPRPGLMGVVPVRGSLKSELVQPYDDIDAHFARHERFGIVDCVCRMERKLLGSECTKPVNRCGFVGLPPQTPLSEHVLDREQALKLFKELEDEGHVHTGFYGFLSGAESPQFVGCCNCCGDCCGILRAVNEFGVKEGPQRSNYRAQVKPEGCVACGECISRCQVHAIQESETGLPEIKRDRCIGCGLCVVRCAGEAIELVPVLKEEWFEVPTSFEDWEERRLANLSGQGSP